MIFEFAGVSGVGKTTLITALRNTDKDSVIVCKENSALYDTVWIMRNLSKVSSNLPYIIDHRRWFRCLLSVLQKYKLPMRDIAKLLWHAATLNEALEECDKDRFIYIIDEGVTHFVWSVLMRIHSMDKELAFELLRLFQMPDLLVYVYADTETIKKRLLQRRKRTRILETDDLETEIRRNEVQFRELIRLMIDNDAIEKENVIYIDNN